MEQEIRILHFSNDNGSIEYVIFTEDFNTDSDMFNRGNVDLVSDTKTEMIIPSGFPLENELNRGG